MHRTLPLALPGAHAVSVRLPRRGVTAFLAASALECAMFVVCCFVGIATAMVMRVPAHAGMVPMWETGAAGFRNVHQRI